MLTDLDSIDNRRNKSLWGIQPVLVILSIIRGRIAYRMLIQVNYAKDLCCCDIPDIRHEKLEAVQNHSILPRAVNF